MKTSTYIEMNLPLSVGNTDGLDIMLRKLEYKWEIYHDHLGRLLELRVGHVMLIKVPGFTQWKITLMVHDGFGDINQSLLYESGSLDETLVELIRVLRVRGL